MKISCPQCGAEYQLDEPDIYFSCPFCKNSLFIDLENIVSVYTFKSAIEPHQIGSYLKKDFEKMGFNENLDIIDSIPVYFPFWHIEGEKEVDSASSRFPRKRSGLLSSNRTFFDARSVDYRIELIEIDTQPEDSRKRCLYYYPFFKVTVRFREKNFEFFVNAVSGEVFGEPIPFISGNEVSQFFPLFIAIFLSFLVVNYMFDHFFLSLAINLGLFYLFYQLSLHLVGKRIYRE